MLAGDERAFDAFFEAYFGHVYRFALPRLDGDSDSTREVVLAKLTKVMRKLSQFRGESTLFTWICQVCRHEIVNHIRARRRSRHVVLIDDDPELRKVIDSIEAPDEFDVTSGIGRTETLNLISVVLDRLPVNYGNALEWKYLEGRSVKEIGERLGIGTAAAQSVLARARVAFREALEKVFGADASDIARSLGR